MLAEVLSVVAALGLGPMLLWGTLRGQVRDGPMNTEVHVHTAGDFQNSSLGDQLTGFAKVSDLPVDTMGVRGRPAIGRTRRPLRKSEYVGFHNSRNSQTCPSNIFLGSLRAVGDMLARNALPPTPATRR